MWTIQKHRVNTHSDMDSVQQAYEQFMLRKDLGFKDINGMKKSIEVCRNHKSFFSSKKQVVIIGLGGSSLGTKALAEALYPNQWQEKLIFLDNIDPFTVDAFLADCQRPDDYGWILCSKSGGTIEVTSLYDYCWQFFSQHLNCDITTSTLVITENKKSLLHDFGSQNNLSILEVPQNVGGRFSVFTPVGLMPLSLMGLDFDSTLEGFAAALEDREGVCQLVDFLLQAHQQGEHNFYCFQYCDRLQYWSLWLQQLWSESLGKAKTHAGKSAPVVSTFIPCRGASDQHSVLQQVVEGVEKKFVCFHRVKSSEKGRYRIKNSVLKAPLMDGRPLGELLAVEADATEAAVQQAGVPTLRLDVEDLSPASMAGLMGLWMVSVGVLGELFDINAFNQPGVESGKMIARRVLKGSY